MNLRELRGKDGGPPCDGPWSCVPNASWWVTSDISGKSYLLIQREEALLAQPFDVSTATLSGTPVPVANGVGSFAGATSGLWSVARNGALVYRAGGTGLPQFTWLDPTGARAGDGRRSWPLQRYGTFSRRYAIGLRGCR